MIQVLYVDDEPELLEILKIFLEKTGEFQVTTAQSGEECLQYLRGPAGCDVIISDYQMPRMDGITLLKQIRSEFGDIPFILYTGRGREEIVIEAINNGADFYLQKGGEPAPQFAELAHKVKRAVERRRACKTLRISEARLRDNENLFRQFLNAIPIGVWISDRSGRLIFGNPAGWKIWEADPSSGANAPGFLKGWRLPERTPVCLRDWVHIHTGNENISIPEELLEIETVRGNVRFILNWAAPVRNETGEILGAFVINQDVTGRILAERENERNKSQRETLLQGLPFPTYIIDHEHRIVSWNRALEEYSGIPSGQILGTTEAWRLFYTEPRPCLSDFIVAQTPEDYLSSYYTEAKPSAHADGAYEATEYFPGSNGGSWVLITAAPILDTNGQIIGAVEVLQDITRKLQADTDLKCSLERMQAAFAEARMTQHILEEQNRLLFESEAKYTRLLDITQDIVVETSPDGIITRISRQSETLLGVPPEKFEGVSLVSLVDAPSRSDLEQTMSELRNGKQTCISVQAAAIHADGRKVHLLIRLHRDLDIHGNLLGLCGSARDMTPVIESGNALAESERKLIGILQTIGDEVILQERQQDGRLSGCEEVNASVCRMLQCTRGELLGSLPVEPETGSGSVSGDVIGQSLQSCGTARYQAELRRKDGSCIPAEIHAHTLRLHGKPHVLSVIRESRNCQGSEVTPHRIELRSRVILPVVENEIRNKITIVRGINRVLKKLVDERTTGELLEKQSRALGSLWQQIEFICDSGLSGYDTIRWMNVGTIIRRALLVVDPGEVTRITDTVNWEIHADILAEWVFSAIAGDTLCHGGSLHSLCFSALLSDAGDLVISCRNDNCGRAPDEKENLLSPCPGWQVAPGYELCREILSLTGLEFSGSQGSGIDACFEIRVPPGRYRRAGVNPVEESPACSS